jgi:hypothetical protein
VGVITRASATEFERAKASASAAVGDARQTRVRAIPQAGQQLGHVVHHSTSGDKRRARELSRGAA